MFNRDGRARPCSNDSDLEVGEGEFRLHSRSFRLRQIDSAEHHGRLSYSDQRQVRIDGEAVRGPDPRRIFVFQERGVFPWLTVEGNIGFGLFKAVRR